MAADDRAEVPPGTLDMLLLKTLTLGPLHGYGLAQHIQRVSQDVFQIEEGSLYPALQRLQLRGWVTSEWGQTPTNRRARYYRITAAGRRQLGAEVASFERVTQAIGRVLRAI